MIYEELTPEVRANYGNLISAKDDSPGCIRRRRLLLNDPDYLDKREFNASARRWFMDSIADDSDMCLCTPDARAVVWSEMMDAGIGPHDEWFERSERSRDHDLAVFLAEARVDTERYRRYMDSYEV